MSKEWRKIKKLRAEQLGGKQCEICGTTEGRIIGHHLLSPKEKYKITELCELRCVDCEKIMHEQYPNGNSSVQKLKILRYMLS